MCEFKSSLVSCTGGKIINIKYAFFGRKDYSTCSFGGVSNTNCHVDAAKVVRFNCQNKQLCFINADAGLYGDPCRGTSKYLEFQYGCIPRGDYVVL